MVNDLVSFEIDDYDVVLKVPTDKQKLIAQAMLLMMSERTANVQELSLAMWFFFLTFLVSIEGPGNTQKFNSSVESNVRLSAFMKDMSPVCIKLAKVIPQFASGISDFLDSTGEKLEGVRIVPTILN